MQETETPTPLNRIALSRLATAVAIGLGVCALPVAADGDGEGGTDALDTVEVSAGAPAPGAPLYQSAAIDVVTGEEKDQREGASLGETLEHLPGVTNIGTGNQTGKPVIRGLSGNRIRILSNGIGVDHQQYGVRHPPNIDPFLSDRIEVVRGASSILYGSGALGGAIDVQSLPLRFSDDGERHSEADTLVGYASNNGQWDTGVKGESRGSRWSFSGGIIRRDGDNIETPDGRTAFNSSTPGPFQSGNPSDTPAYTGELDFTDFEQLNAQANAGYRGDFGTLSLRYSGWRNEHNFLLPPPAGNVPPGQGPEGIGQNLENDEIQLGARLPAGDGWTLKPSLTWQNNLRQSNAAGTPRSDLFDGTIDLEFDQYTARVEAGHGVLGPFDAGTIGVEYRQKQQDSRGTTQLAPGGEVENIGVFAFEERTFGDLTLQAGLRHDWHETVGDESRTRAATTFSGKDRNDYSVTTGSLGGVFALTDRMALAANLGRGFRAPTLFELYADGVHGGVAAVQQGNSDLEPERSLNTDIGLRWQSRGLAASATVYRNRIDDYIYLQDTGTTAGNGLPVFGYRQDDAVLTGLELQARGMVSEAVELAGTLDVVDGENDATGEDLPLQPADEARVEATWFPDAWTDVRNPWIRLGVRYNASKDAAPGEPFAQFDNAPFGSASTDSYTVADLSLGFAFGGTADRPMRFDLAIRNVTDEKYRDFLDTYKGYARSPGRDIRLRLRVPFGT